MCTTLPNKDRLGFDLANAKGTLDSCTAACEKQAGCRTYTWDEYQGGICWLKSYPDKLFDKAGVTTTDCIRDTPSLIFSAYQNMDFVGMEIGSKPANLFVDCCNICNEFTDCTAFSWTEYNNGTCWLKKSVGHVVTKLNVLSASIVVLYWPVCPFQYDIDFRGNDIGNNRRWTLARAARSARPTRIATYSWSNHKSGTYWMKSAQGETIRSAGEISALLTAF